MRVLILTHQEVDLPPNVDQLDVREFAPWKTEYDVITVLRNLGHSSKMLCGIDEVSALRTALFEYEPHVVFNLLEEFRGEGVYVPYVLGYLELMRQPFTGCNPAGLLIADNKPLAKKILRYHRVPIPGFAVFQRGRRIKKPVALNYPLIVKSSTEHGSVGIAQASVVTNDDKLRERIEFIQNQIGTDAIAEEYVHGREFYVGVLGNRRLRTFPVWEMEFGKVPDGSPLIATSRVKWDIDYQEKKGITTGAARALPSGVEERMVKLSKRVFRLLSLSGYARMDFRLSEDDKLYLLEANPNPDLAIDEDFAMSAQAAKVEYEPLIKKILALAKRYQKHPRS